MPTMTVVRSRGNSIPAGRLPGRFEQEHVLRVRELEVARGEAQAGQPDVDGQTRARMPLAEQDRPPEVLRIVAVHRPSRRSR